MSLPARVAMTTLVLVALRSPDAEAEEAPAPAVSSMQLQAVKDQVVVVGVKDGTELTGRVLLVAQDHVVVAKLPGNEVVELHADALTSLRLVPARPAASPSGQEGSASVPPTGARTAAHRGTWA